MYQVLANLNLPPSPKIERRFNDRNPLGLCALINAHLRSRLTEGIDSEARRP